MELSYLSLLPVGNEVICWEQTKNTLCGNMIHWLKWTIVVYRTENSRKLSTVFMTINETSIGWFIQQILSNSCSGPGTPWGDSTQSIRSDSRPTRVQAFRKTHGSVLTQGHLVTLKAHLASAVANAKLQLPLKRIQPVWEAHMWQLRIRKTAPL